MKVNFSTTNSFQGAPMYSYYSIGNTAQPVAADITPGCSQTQNNYATSPNFASRNYFLGTNPIGGTSYLRLGNKTINGKEYYQYQLNNGTTVLIRPDDKSDSASISTSVKNASYGFSSPFNNMTEAHLFEHLCGNNQLNNNGYFQRIDDGLSGNEIRLVAEVNPSDLKNIINSQANTLYKDNFTQEVFDREKQALNIELALKGNRGGNRNEINDIDLNHLRQIRNKLVKPSNIEIIVEGNVNPEDVMRDISQTTANIPSAQIQPLQDINYQKNNVYSGNDLSVAGLTLKTGNLNSADKTKTLAVLNLIKILAETSDKINLDSQARAYSYGGNIGVCDTGDGSLALVYENETFTQNQKTLENIYKSNFEKLKYTRISEEDLNAAKKSLAYNFDILCYNCKTPKQEILKAAENINLQDIYSVINSLSPVQ